MPHRKKKKQMISRRNYTDTDANDADDQVVLENTPTKDECLRHSLDQTKRQWTQKDRSHVIFLNKEPSPF